jgi:hypothetical protein
MMQRVARQTDRQGYTLINLGGEGRKVAREELEPSGLRHWHGMAWMHWKQINKNIFTKLIPPGSGRPEGLDEIERPMRLLEMARSGYQTSVGRNLWAVDRSSINRDLMASSLTRIRSGILVFTLGKLGPRTTNESSNESPKGPGT